MDSRQYFKHYSTDIYTVNADRESVSNIFIDLNNSTY